MPNVLAFHSSLQSPKAQKKVISILPDQSAPSFDLIFDPEPQIKRSSSVECLNDLEGFVQPEPKVVDTTIPSWDEYQLRLSSGALECRIHPFNFKFNVNEWSFEHSLYAEPEPKTFTEKHQLPKKSWSYKGRTKLSDSVTAVLDNWVLNYKEGHLKKGEKVFELGHSWCNNEQIEELVFSRWISGEVLFLTNYKLILYSYTDMYILLLQYSL